ncbi:hypothetical protein DBV15_11108 [Temnothorax longispinosus]|uniref:Uncharacterized protein n=1 Tax=Temnothorax longispinosus TaxID=300112 RepID=A0A4S2KUH6_9HYME|nr:hypothetical protein DBV15_11108 [Temnothorax longispinosus]
MPLRLAVCFYLREYDEQWLQRCSAFESVLENSDDLSLSRKSVLLYLKKLEYYCVKSASLVDESFSGNQEFRKRFSQSDDPSLLRKSVLLYLKKLEYYWIKSAGARFLSTSGEEFPLDIDDEQDLLDFKTRSLNVNFEDPYELWSALFEEEIQEFELLIKIKKTERLVIINSYAQNGIIIIITLYYIGYYLKCIQETARVFVTICENMRNNKIFKDADEAIESVIEYVKVKPRTPVLNLNVNGLPQDEQTLSVLTLAPPSCKNQASR